MMAFGFGGLGFLVMILFWVVVLGLALWVVARIFPQSASPSPPSSGPATGESAAEDILKRRYAGGEISQSQYEEMRETLRR